MSTGRSDRASGSTPGFRLLPPIILFAVGIGWGAGVSLVKFATAHGIAPLGYLFWLTVGGGLIAFGICAARRNLPRLTPTHLKYYGLTAGVRVAGANFILYTVVQHIPAGVMAVVLGTAPMFTYGLAYLFRMETFVPVRLIGLGCGFAGVVLFVAPRNSLPDPAMAGWVLAALGAPILYSIGNIVIERYRPAEGDSITFAVGMMWTASLIILPVAILTGQFHALWRPPSWAEYALFTHMMISGLGFFGLYELIRIAGPTYASQIADVVTLAGVVFGIAIFGEVHSIWVWAATAMVLSGIALVNSRPARRGPE